MEVDRKKFARRFKELKKKADLTQKEIAAKLGVKRSTVGSWETGSRIPLIESAIKLAEAWVSKTILQIKAPLRRAGLREGAGRSGSMD